MLRELDQVKRQLDKGDLNIETVSFLVDAVEEHMKELSKFTVGGSEFHRNPSMCLNYIKTRFERLTKLHFQVIELKKELRDKNQQGG